MASTLGQTRTPLHMDGGLDHFFPNSILLDLAKDGFTSFFPEFEGCGSKTAPITPISILNFSRAWQPHFLRYTLQILVKHASFIGKQMMFLQLRFFSNGIVMVSC